MFNKLLLCKDLSRNLFLFTANMPLYYANEAFCIFYLIHKSKLFAGATGLVYVKSRVYLKNIATYFKMPLVMHLCIKPNSGIDSFKATTFANSNTF